MKRISCIIFLTLVMVAFGVSTSFAEAMLYNGVCDNGLSSNPYDDPVLNVQYVPCERVHPTNGYDLKLRSPNPDYATIGSGIVLRANDNIGSGTTITFTLTNAKFGAPDQGYDYKLFVYNDGSGIITKVGDLVSGGAFSASASFLTTAPIAYDTLVGMIACQTNTGATGIFNGWDVQTDFPLTCDGSLWENGGDVSVACAVSGYPDATVGPTVFQSYRHQFNIHPMSWSGRNFLGGQIGMDLIDATRLANRRWFVNNTKIADDAAFMLNEDLINWDSAEILSGFEIDTVRLNLTGDFTGIQYPAEDIAIGNLPTGIVPLRTWDPITQTLSFDIDHDLLILPEVWGMLFSGLNHFEMIVDGATVLDNRAWYLSAEIEMGFPEANGQDYTLAQTVIGEWQVTGKQFLVPLVRATDDNNNRSFVRFVNDNSNPADVFCDVLVDDGYVKSLFMGEILAHQAQMYTGADINAKMLLLGYADGANFATRWTLTTQHNNWTENAGRRLFCTAWMTMNTGDVWATRLLTVYEDNQVNLRESHNGATGSLRLK